MTPLVPRSAESLAPPVPPPTAAPTVMPPWPWEDERMVEPPGMTIPEFIAWAREAYADYPEFLHALLYPALPHTYVVED